MTDRFTRRAVLKGASAVLATPMLMGCSGTSVWAPDDMVQRARYLGTGDTALVLYTMKNAGSGNGAHTALLVDASQRVLFDPAGSFSHPSIPERNDVLFGISPALERYYVSYHARQSYYVVGQRIAVSPQVAEMALQLVQRNGAVPMTHCARATSRILQQLPGFTHIGRTWFPNSLEWHFAQFPAVVTQEYRETDSDNKARAAAQQEAAIRDAVAAAR